VEHQRLSAIAQQGILGPLGLVHSSFAQPPDDPNRAAGHHEGRPFVDKAYLTGETAAGGLWSTPSDLARFLIAMRKAAIGEDESLLPKPLVEAMLTKGKGDWGLGFVIDGPRFGHDGGFWGMMSRMWIDRDTGDGMVVMANDVEGIPLANEIIRAAAVRYGWTDLQPRSFAAARDAGPLYVRGTMNDWGIATPLIRGDDGRYTALVTLSGDPQALKIASADWTFALGSSRAALEQDIALPLTGDGIDVEFTPPRAGDYRVIVDAPDTGLPTLTIVPVAP